MWDNYLMREYLSYPGGITEYFSIFLFQFTTIPLLGALVYTLLLAGIIFMVDQILSTKNEKAIVILKFIPAILLGVLLTNYSFPIVFLVLLFFQLFFIFIYKKISKSNSIVSVPLIILLISLTHFLIGGFAFVIFILSVFLYELFNKNRNKILKIGLIFVLGLAVPVLSTRYLYFISLSDAFFRLEPFLNDYKSSFILYFLFVSIPILYVLQKVLNHLPLKWKGIVSFQLIQYLLVFTTFIILFFIKFDADAKQKIEVNRYAYLGEWEKVLESVDEKPSDDRLINFQTNRALFHTGKMPYELFDYPQKWGIDGLFLTRFFTGDILLPSTQLLLELSYVNEAIHLGNEAISNNEKSPQVIQQLIIAYMVANKYKSATMYINVLKKFPFFKKKALEFAQMIVNDTPDDNILKHRSMMAFSNFRISQMPEAEELLSLLNDHPENKMVYEYLMTYFLLNNDVASFMLHYSKGKDFNYGDLPRVFQEAIVLYVYNLRKSGKPVPKLNLDKNVVNDFTNYIKLLTQFDGDKDEAEIFLTENYPNTYWYYLHYTSPVTNKLKVVSE